MITIENLTRCYGDYVAVDAVSFAVQHGEVVGLLGHNGAGKTTIMKMLTGYLEPTGGTVHVDELQLGRDTATIQKRIGYLPENCPVWPEMTVAEFLEYQAVLHNVAPGRRAAAVASAIRRTELRERITQPIQTLSRGYRQRVGVAQAILHQPDIIILDEPTNGLDPTQIRHMRALIGELARTATVIVSTHILQEVQAVCGRVIILRAGRKVVDARLDELQRQTHLLLTIDREERAAFGVLQSIPGVAAVRLLSQGDGRYHYALEAPDTLAPAVSAAVHQAGFALYALGREQRTLESVFTEVNAAPAPTQVRHAA